MTVFENTGEIDLRTVCTFGCSVKEGSNPIGFFGTGLKYAIAVLLRTGHTVVLQSGINQVEVTSRKDEIRGKEFDFVFIADAPAGFTTELGKTWEVWMAYRELYCNAKDEPHPKIYTSEARPKAVANVTRIIVDGLPISEAHRTREEFILESKPLYVIGNIEIHGGPSRSFFYKGIKVMDFAKVAMFTYNQTDHVALTEDRTAKEPYMVGPNIARAMLEHGEAELLEKVLTAGDVHVEQAFDFCWTSVTPGRDFYPTIEKLQRSQLMKVNQTAIRMWRQNGNGFFNPRRIQPTAVQASTLEKAIAFCEKIGFMLRNEYPITIVETLGENGVLAIADRVGKQIYLTERLFEESGTKGVARALVEEYAHLKFGLNDESREMQTFLLGKMVSLGEELSGEPL